MRNKCPHCNKTRVIPEVAITNAENYGSTTVLLSCPKCGKQVKAFIERSVSVYRVEKSNHSPSEDSFKIR